jgi:hypothetical protein
MSVQQTEPWTGEAVPAPAMARRWSPVLVIGLYALTAIAIQSLWIPLDADVSWLITVCERILSGARLYVDVIEVNPPASVWLYLPLVWIAQAIGVQPEAVVVAGFVAGGMASSLWTVKLASRLEDAPRPALVAFAAGFVNLVFPMALFAQREHAALLLALPALAALALVTEGKPLRFSTALLAGFAAGLVIAIKPHFALAIVPAALWAAYRRRSLMPIVPAAFAAAAALAFYAAAFLLWAKAYLGWLPAISHTYLLFHDSWWNVVANPLLFPTIVLLLALLLRPARLPVLAIISAMAAIGFAAAAIIQAKGYPNHLYPGAALALFAAVVIVGSVSPRRKKWLVTAGLAAACLWQVHAWAILPDRKLAAAITQVAPTHPKIIALSRELATGHPVTRNVGGTWVGSRAGVYFAGLAHDQGLRDPIAADAYRKDTHDFARDVALNSPDVILVDRRDKAWLMREPQIAQAMHGYGPRARAGNIEVWVRGSVNHSFEPPH